MSKLDDRWVLTPRPQPDARLRLLCFPFAGGSAATAYRTWPAGFPAQVEVGLVQLPGRERRLREAPYTNLNGLVKALAEALAPSLGHKPFAFFGHSMGALISYELSVYLQQNYGLSPVHLFLSAHRAPSVPRRREEIHRLPDEAFKEKVAVLNGTPPEVLAHDELMALVLPLLRADFTLCETYRPGPPLPLAVPFSVFGGHRDPEVQEPDLRAWEAYSTGTFRLRMYPGDHFYLKEAQGSLVQAMLHDLREVINS